MAQRIVAGTGPIDVEPGQACWWRRGGRSGRQPFCGIRHKRG